MAGGNRSGAARLALLGAAALLITLGGCGRKAGLDLPPGAGAAAPSYNGTPGAPTSPQINPLGPLEASPQDEKPVAAPGQKKRIILDPILD